jgi:hypothetical protein
MKKYFFRSLVLLLSISPFVRAQPESSGTAVEISSVSVSSSTVSLRKPVHSIHLTAWMAGSKKERKIVDELIAGTLINSVTIDVKEYEGEVYIPGIKATEEVHSYVPAVPDLPQWIAGLKKRGVYTVARIVVFKDNIYPRKRPSTGVHAAGGGLWRDRHHVTWIDPYNHDAWRYINLIALQASKIGFDEVQFDYLRFPTDGKLSQIRFSSPYSKEAASRTLIEFLSQAEQLLHPLGTKVSIDVFGLTTTVNTGMGIGQLMIPMAAKVDYICPMVYPSHYYAGEYGIPNPNKEPYRTVHHSLHDAIKNLGPSAHKLRPYLQDFSLGVHYGVKEVRAQIQAAADLGIQDWTLWNPRCVYTKQAITSPVTPKPLTQPTTGVSNN